MLAAVETNEQGHPLRMKLTVVEGFRLTEIAAWAQLHLGTGTRVVSDGLACFHGVTAAGCVHEPVVVGSGKAAVERPEFRWVNTILGNIKNALRGTYHAIRPKYAQRYLSEFEYRFNRRFDLPDIIPRLVYVALRTPPMPERLLKLRFPSARFSPLGEVDVRVPKCSREPLVTFGAARASMRRFRGCTCIPAMRQAVGALSGRGGRP